MLGRLKLAGGAFLGGLGIYLLLYQPLVHQLKVQGSATRAIEDELARARSLVAGEKGKERERTFIKEEEVSRAIDELTKEGKLKGIGFISMTPGSLEKSADSRFRILPIEMETESSYEDLGRFLGSLDDLKASLVTVASLHAAPERQNSSQLRAKLVLDLYLAS